MRVPSSIGSFSHPAGLFIPALPPKKALGILDDDFLVERLADLGDFLVRVSAHGMLRDCAAFRCCARVCAGVCGVSE